jgi:hypothetical protein
MLSQNYTLQAYAFCCHSTCVVHMSPFNVSILSQKGGISVQTRIRQTAIAMHSKVWRSKMLYQRESKKQS